MGLLVVCCPKALLLWWHAVLTPGHYLIGAVAAVLSQATAVVVAVLFSPPVHYLLGAAGVVLSQATAVVVGVLFSPPGHYLTVAAGAVLSQATAVVVGVMFSPPGHFWLETLVLCCPEPLQSRDARQNIPVGFVCCSQPKTFVN